MTGYEYICASIEIFESSLAASADGPVIKTVGELARRTGYSVFHFTRLFSAIAGMNPKEYVSGRLLSEAGRRIAGSKRPLGPIAAEFGFPDYEVFSRAFKRRFGVTPSSVRESRSFPFDGLRRLVPKQPGNAPSVALREPALVTKEKHCLTGIAFFIEPDIPSFHRQWAVFASAQKAIVGRVQPETYCQFSSWTNDENINGLAVLCALETEIGIAQEPVFTTRIVPAASYLRFAHTGDISTIHQTYEYIYREWLASHDMSPLDMWEFQQYADNGRTTGIYIPVALV